MAQITCLRIEINRSIRYHDRWLESGSAWQGQAIPVPWPNCAIDSALKRNQPQKPGRVFCVDVRRGCGSVFAPVLLHGAVGFSTMANSYSGMFACSCLRKFPILLTTNRRFMLTSQTFTLSRKCGARDLEKGCWTKRCHGVALREPTRLFSGRLQEANRFIGDAAWFSRGISSNCEMVLLKRADFNVEPLLGPFTRLSLRRP
jgi:hypothetical protein